MVDFLYYECGLTFLDLAVVTYDHYRALERGWMRKVEREQHYTRTISFYSMVQHQGKRGRVKKPSDLWKIGDELKSEVVISDAEKRRQRKKRKQLREEFESKGIKLIIA